MTNGLRRSILFLLCTLPGGALAATLIESRDGSGELTQMWIEGDMARFQQPGKEGHMLMDLRHGRLYGVDDVRKQAMEIDLGNSTAQTEAGKLDARLEDKGAGPEIAGYPTRRYLLTGAGEACGEYFLSKRALEHKDIRRMADSFRNMPTDADASDAACDLAEHYAVTRFPELGFPMRQVSSEGIQHEIVRIQANAKAPGSFSIPADYRRITMQQMMEEMLRQQQNLGR